MLQGIKFDREKKLFFKSRIIIGMYFRGSNFLGVQRHLIYVKHFPRMAKSNKLCNKQIWSNNYKKNN